MGGEVSKPKREKPPPPKKPKVKKIPQQVYDYMPNSSRNRPKSAHSWSEVQHVTMLGQQGRSSSVYDEFSSQSLINHSTPKWQSKWEIDMRPDPTSEDKSMLRPWQSMPLPTTDNATTMLKVTAVHRPTVKRAKKGKTREHRASLGREPVPLPEVEETDRFERISVSSLQVDGFKMIYKTDTRTDNFIDQTAKLWQLEPRKMNKQWFLGHDSHLLQETVPSVPKKHTINVKKANTVTGKTPLTRKTPLTGKKAGNTKTEPILEEY